MRFLIIIAKLLPSQPVYAHCDVPCGVYDPYQAQLAAISVIRMTDMINDLQVSSENAPFEERKKIIHQVTRLTKVKEDHAEIVKHEVRVIWGDYFKEEHLKEYPHLHTLVFLIMKLASKTRQNIDKDAAAELLSKVQEFAHIFWKTKGRETTKIKSSSPSDGELIIPQ